MKTTQQRIEEIRQEGYPFDFSTVFNDAFEIYKRLALMSGLALMVLTVVFVGLAIGIFGAMSSVTDMSSLAGFDVANLHGVALLTYSASVIIISALATPFMGGFIYMASVVDQGGDASFGDAFYGYKSPNFLPLFITGLLISSVSVGVTTLIQVAVPSLYFVGSIFSLCVSLFTMMAVPLVLFGKLAPLDAIKGSIVVVSKNVGYLILLSIVGTFLSAVGLIGFCIGIFFTAAFIYVIYYSIYKHSVGLGDESEIDEIGLSDEYDRF